MYTNRFRLAGEWNRSVAVAQAPQGASQVRVVLAAAGSGTGQVYFDNVQVEKAPHVSAYNLLENAGFERGAPYVEHWLSTNLPFSWSNTAFSGALSVSLTNASATSGLEPTYLLPYDGTRPLTLSAFVKTENLRSGSAYVKLKWYDAQGALISSTNSTTRRSGTNDWTRLYVQVPPGQAPARAAHVKPSLVVEVNAGGTVGTAYFDAVRLEEALVATAYEYGVPGEAAHNNWVTRITNPAGDFLTFAYNGSGFVTKVTPNGNAAQAVTYTPDGLQRLRSVSLPNGLTTSYSYTGNGLLSSVTHAGTDGTAPTSYTYNRRDQLVLVTDPIDRETRLSYGPDGNLTGMTQPDGTVISLGYDAANRLSHRSFGSTTYTFAYNANSLLSQASDGTRTWSYGYDAVNRLTSATNLTGTVSYDYDRNSNRTSLLATVGSRTFGSTLAYDELDRLVRVEDRSGTSHVRFSYDERGALVKWATAMWSRWLTAWAAWSTHVRMTYGARQTWPIPGSRGSQVP